MDVYTFSIYPCPLSFWLTLPRRVLSTSWCCPSRPCVAFLAFVHLASFLALSLSPGNSLVSSWCDRSMLASLLWRCLTVPSLLQLCSEPSHLYFLCCPRNPQNFSRSFHLKGVKFHLRLINRMSPKWCTVYNSVIGVIWNRHSFSSRQSTEKFT